ncbi:MAG TPA: hypothetical protein VM580_22090 [Labilithrix sp.]|jgi:hypothetical protein|nr:hypothetical protein [Labilithrix sp.]
MTKQTIFGDVVEVSFENRFVILYWNEAEGWVGTCWKKVRLGDDWTAANTVRESLELGLDLIRKKGTSRWLSDSRDMAVMPPDVQEWLTGDWWPRALSAGFRWLGILLPQSALAKMAIDVTLPEGEEGPQSETRYFAEVDAAKSWLRSKA